MKFSFHFWLDLCIIPYQEVYDRMFIIVSHFRLQYIYSLLANTMFNVTLTVRKTFFFVIFVKVNSFMIINSWLLSLIIVLNKLKVLSSVAIMFYSKQKYLNYCRTINYQCIFIQIFVKPSHSDQENTHHFKFLGTDAS